MGHLITTPRWQQVAAMAGVPMLAAATTAEPIAPGLGAATTSTTARSLLAGSITGGRLGGITRAATSLLLQLGDKGGQCIQLNDELLNQRANAGRCGLPVIVCDATDRGVHLRVSLPEIQPAGGDLPRPAVQIRLDTTHEHIPFCYNSFKPVLLSEASY